MDQIEKIYNELIGYDPWLSKDKEAVLQLIKKMLAAKPTIAVSQQWKEQFATKLSDHIASSHSSIHSSAYTWRWYSKWAVSFVSTFVVLVIAGASYWWWYLHNSKFSTLDSQLSSENSITESGAFIADDAKVAIVPHETSSQRDQAIPQQTWKTNQLSTALDVSTDVDNSVSIEKPQALPAIWWGGGNPIMMASKAESPATWNEFHKKVAFVVIDMSWSDIGSEAMNVINTYNIPVTYIDATGGLNVEQFSGEISTLTENNIATLSWSLAPRAIVFLNVSFVSMHADAFEMLVERLLAQGYLFVALSAMRQ